MNRRIFLKRIAAVAVGAVAVPAVAKKLPFKPNPIQRTILYGNNTVPRYKWRFSRMGNPYSFDPPSMPSKYPDYPLGTLYKASDGSVYVYVKNTTKLNMPFNCYLTSEGQC